MTSAKPVYSIRKLVLRRVYNDDDVDTRYIAKPFQHMEYKFQYWKAQGRWICFYVWRDEEDGGWRNNVLAVKRLLKDCRAAAQAHYNERLMPALKEVQP